jgi:FMN phosphatase YigB (HAD superfamily)
VTAVIFDLDNTLAPADEPGVALFDPLVAAVRSANHGRLGEDALAAAFRDCWRLPFDLVAERHGFSDVMRAAGWQALVGLEVRRPMRGYGDLGLLPRLGRRRFLVTTGFRRLQESKVRALGIEAACAEGMIDAIEEPGHPGKEGIFADLVARHGLDRAGVWVVGDNPDAELAAARRLGLHAVQVLRPGVVPAPGTAAQVRDLADLATLLRDEVDRGGEPNRDS